MLIDYLLTFALFRQVYKKVWEPVDNGQLEVLWNLSKYLKLSANLPTTTLQYSLQIGHCVGLSICHGAMAKTHQIEWWESALVQVALWDGEIASLNTMILLPGASNNKAIPLSLILIRVLNYVKSCQIDNSAYSFSKSGITCLNLMSPATKGFEILEQNKIKSILKSTQFVGYFSKKQLAKLLSGAYIKDRICVIYNTCHAIRIGYSDKDQWVVYDPNYPHRNRNQPLYKQFSKAGAIDEIVRILGYSLHIQISHLDRRKVLPNPVHEYEKMLKNEMADLLKEFGLQQITRVAHHLMPRILNAAKSSKKVANSFAEGLCKLPEKIWRDSKYQSVYNSALQHIAELCPEYLEESLKVASCADNGISLISQGFENFIVESSYACTLIRIAKYKPQLFPKVLDYIEAYTKEKCPIIFAEALNSHYKIENCYANGLSVFDKFVGNHLPRIIAKISEHHDASFYFLSALLYLEKKTNPDGTYYCTMCVEELCNAKSKNLTSILKLVTDDLNPLNFSVALERIYRRTLMLIGMLFAVSGVINIIADNFSQFFFMLQVLKILLLIPFFKVTTIVANDIYKLNPNHLSFNDELKVDLSSKKVLFASGSPSLPTGYFSKSSTFFKRLENIMSKKIPDPLINEHRELHKKLQDINTLYSGIN